MEFHWLQIVLVGLIFFFSSVVQGAVGFAAGMFGVPLFLLCGFELQQAVAFALIASLVSNLSGAWQLRHEVDLRVVVLPVALRIVAQPLGAWAMFVVGQYKETAAQVVGGVLLAMLLLQGLLRVEPREKLHPAWAWIAFPLSGFLFSFCSMGGPPLVMWVMGHKWSAIRMRAYLFFVFASGLLPQLLLLLYFYKASILPALAVGCLAIPVLLIGTHVGLALGNRLPDHHLRRFSVGLLVMLGASALLMPWIR